MKNKQYLRKLIVSLLTGIIAICGVQKYFSVSAQEDKKIENQPPPNVLCYRAASVDRPVQSTQEQLQNQQLQLKTLEEKYKDGKINEQAYTQRKNVLQDRIDKLNEQLKED